MFNILKEKRRFPRKSFKMPLRCQIRGTSKFNNTVSEDIGAGGVSFLSDDFIALNTQVDIEINIASRMITATGRIARINCMPYSDKYRLGVEFYTQPAQNTQLG